MINLFNGRRWVWVRVEIDQTVGVPYASMFLRALSDALFGSKIGLAEARDLSLDIKKYGYCYMRVPRELVSLIKDAAHRREIKVIEDHEGANEQPLIEWSQHAHDQRTFLGNVFHKVDDFYKIEAGELGIELSA